jgi:hypothetical protein
MPPRVKIGRRMPQTIAAPPAQRVEEHITRLRTVYFRNRCDLAMITGKTDTFCVNTHYPTWDGGKNRWGNNCKPVWPAIIQHINNNNCDIEGFVTAQFQAIVAISAKWQPPPPNHLKTNTAVRIYHDYNITAQNQFRCSLVTQHHVFENEYITKEGFFPGATPAEYWILILQDTGNALTPLYRYCIGRAQKFEKICDMFQLSAYDQFLLDPVNYIRYWTDMIPNEFRNPVITLLQTEKDLK